MYSQRRMCRESVRKEVHVLAEDHYESILNGALAVLRHAIDLYSELIESSPPIAYLPIESERDESWYEEGGDNGVREESYLVANETDTRVEAWMWVPLHTRQ